LVLYREERENEDKRWRSTDYSSEHFNNHLTTKAFSKDMKFISPVADSD